MPIRINIEMIFVGAAVMRETLRVYFMGVGDFVMWCDFITRKISDINVVGTPLNTTDVFDSATGKWSTAELSVARYMMGAVSVGRFALFAGGNIQWGTLQGRNRITFSSDCVFDICDLIGG